MKNHGESSIYLYRFDICDFCLYVIGKVWTVISTLKKTEHIQIVLKVTLSVLMVKYHMTTNVTCSRSTASVGQMCLICLSDIRVIRYDGSSLRNFTSSSQLSIDVSYEQLKKLLLSDSSVVIDVREPWELREYGNIPGSINVPCKSMHGLIRILFI